MVQPADPNQPAPSGAVVWLDGRFVDPEEARIGAFDAGVQHAVGLFETMLAAPDPAGGARIVDVDAHMARLASSASALRLTESLRTRALAEAAALAVERSGLCAAPDGRARLRLTLTGGDLQLLERGADRAHDPTILLSVTPATVYPEAMFARGIGLRVASDRANPLNRFEGHKTLNYWWRLRALQEAAAVGAGEALVLQVSNHVAGGAVSNLLAVVNGTLRTPIARGEEDAGGIPSPVLPGVTRAAVIEIARRRSIGCERRMLTIDDVLDADEVLLTNSSWGVLPVTAIEGKTIGTGEPGEMTRDLRSAWLAHVEGR